MSEKNFCQKASTLKLKFVPEHRFFSPVNIRIGSFKISKDVKREYWLVFIFFLKSGFPGSKWHKICSISTFNLSPSITAALISSMKLSIKNFALLEELASSKKQSVHSLTPFLDRPRSLIFDSRFDSSRPLNLVYPRLWVWLLPSNCHWQALKLLQMMTFGNPFIF